MTARSRLLRGWSAQAWRWVLQALEAMAGLDLTGQFTGGWPPQYSDIPVEWAYCATIAVPHAWWTLDPAGWAHCTQWAHEPPAVMTKATQQAVAERLPEYTSAEQARLRVLRDRYQANRTPFTPREQAHLNFVRWLHRTGRITG